MIRTILISLSIFMTFAANAQNGQVLITVMQIETNGERNLSRKSGIRVFAQSEPLNPKKSPECKTNKIGFCKLQKKTMTYYFIASKDDYRSQKKQVMVNADSLQFINFLIYHKKYEIEQKKKIMAMSIMSVPLYNKAVEELDEYYENYGVVDNQKN